ncbi:hypothetical protein BC833DRAFT_621747 [Globomyces pollinis-pini]|nr:hypothetical protein BC833DRAFT_621747 [Globomyces pollinis-pini]
MGLVLTNLDWKPFKSKQPYVLLVSLASATVWWIGSLQSIGIIDQTGIFSNCVLWTVWCQLVLGVQLTITCMIYRILRLYFILVLVKKPNSNVFYLLVFGAHLPALILGLLPIAKKNYFITNQPVPIQANPSGPPACDFSIHPYYLNMMYGIAGLGIIILTFLNYKVSTVRRAFNEFNENKASLIILTVILLVNVVISATGFQNLDLGKILVSFTQLIAALCLFWSAMFAPIKGFIVDKDGFYTSWRQGLIDESLPSELQYNNTDGSSIQLSMIDKKMSVP